MFAGKLCGGKESRPLAASATTLARGLHHGLATAVTLGARGIDALAGEGATSRKTNQLRTAAQQGVEVVEDVGEWAQGLWESLCPETDTEQALLR